MKDVNKLLVLTATLLLASCGVASDDGLPSGDPAQRTRRETSPDSPAGVDVKVTRNGKTLAAFRSASDNTGVGALLVGDDLSIDITSPDQKWVLTISVPRGKAGTHRLAAMREEGKAMIVLAGGGEGEEIMVRAQTGELKLDEVSESYCSGTFQGTGTDATGNKYSYEGRFSRIRARRHE